MMISVPGVYSMSDIAYHSDPCPAPSLSASIATIINQQSLLHAFMQHPKLGKKESKDSDVFSFGRAAHALLLEADSQKVVPLPYSDFRTSKARQMRDECVHAGDIPLCLSDYEKVSEMIKVAKGFIESSELSGLFENGKTEQTFVGFSDCWVRGRCDYITNNRKLILDYKTVGRTANPSVFMQSVFNYGYDIQAAMYLHLNKITGHTGECDFVWLIQEKEAPYACSFIGASQSVLDIGQKKFEFAKTKWVNALSSNSFAGYSNNITWPEASSWERAKAEAIGFEED